MAFTGSHSQKETPEAVQISIRQSLFNLQIAFSDLLAKLKKIGKSYCAHFDLLTVEFSHNSFPFQTDSLEEKNNERNRAESHKLSGIGEKDPEEKQEQPPPIKKSSPTSQQQSQQARYDAIFMMCVLDTFHSG